MSCGEWLWRSIKRDFPHYLTAIFTLGLAIFAFYAWRESRAGTQALEDQLLAMKAEQRPSLWIVSSTQPRLSLRDGRIDVDVTYANFGQGIAYNITTQRYMKVGDDPYQVNPVPAGVGGLQMPPQKVEFLSVLSRPGLSQTYVNDLLTKDLALGVLIEFSYTDITGKERYSDTVCMEHLATGTWAYRNPGKECHK
jgi:hypothetical protein